MARKQGFNVYATPALRKIRRLLAEGFLTPDEARQQGTMLRRLIMSLAKARSDDLEALNALEADLAEQFKDDAPTVH